MKRKQIIRRSLELERERKKEIEKNLCKACSGSGIYDTFGSPPCGACGGTGKERANG